MKKKTCQTLSKVVLLIGSLVTNSVLAASAGLPLSEDFADQTLMDSSATSANWSSEEQALILAWKQRHYGVFGSGLLGQDITADVNDNISAALGDIDGDGDLDLVVGGDNEPNRLYLNNGTADPFNGVIGTDITADADTAWALALGDFDGDGDLDLVVGNDGQTNRLYQNNGTADPFNGITGSDITADMHATESITLGDVDGDGDLDLVAGNSVQANRLYLNNGSADPFNGVTGSDVTADVHSTYAVNLGDMDGDGDLDLVAGNRSQTNRLYLNNGTADPFNGVTGSDITTDTHDTYSITLGDVDGDGDLDLALGNYNQSNRLYLNNGGADPFNGVTGSDLTADAHRTNAVTLGDVDSDGDLDLVVGNDFQTNRLYQNNGTADPFNGVAGIDITADVNTTYAVTLGDMDGDGDLDLVEANSGGINRLYLNHGTTDPFNGTSGSDMTADAHSTTSIALGDMDGDGDQDLVTGNDTQTNRLYLNNGTTDPFNGVTGSDITADAHNTNAVTLGDLDGDGDLDLVAGNNAQANRLYLNNGTSDPFNGVTGSDITADAHNTNAVTLGDMDSDGDLDLVAGNLTQANRLYLNNGTADPFNGVAGSDTTADAHDTRAVILGDVDGDGDLDLVAGNDTQANRLYLNNGGADPFNGITGSDLTADAHSTNAITLGDLDGDGDLDLVVGNSVQTNRLYLNNGSADPFNGVTGSDITTDAHDTRSVTLGDVDGDGDLDLAAGNNLQTNRLYLNNGTTDPFSGTTGSDITADAGDTLSAALGDMDGDGNLDLVTGNTAQTNRLYLNNGSNDAFVGITGADITADTHSILSIALGDMDNDGDLDLVAGNLSSANRLYLNNDTTDPFNGVTGSNITTDNHLTYSVALGDVDGDGDLDLVVGNKNQSNRLYLNNGTVDPFNGVTGADTTADAHATLSVTLGDVDGDGDLDLVAGNQNQTNRLYLNNGTVDPFNGVTGADITADAHDTRSVALGDMDGDGHLDLAAGNQNQTNRLYLNNGTVDPFNGVTGADITTDAHQTRSITPGDMDGDGDQDLVVGNWGQTNWLYLNNGTVDPFAGVTGANITVNTHSTASITLGDVDSDGDLDLVAGNSGQANRLYLNNGSADPFNGVTGADITADAHNTPSIALGDVDGDGKLDLVAGNYTGETNRLYQRELYNTAGTVGASIRVDTETSNIDTALLAVTETVPVHTVLRYYLSNDGGGRYFQVQPNQLFWFPTGGMDLRWRVELVSASPVITPRLDSLSLSTYKQPLITGPVAVTMLLNTDLTLVLADLTVTDPDNVYPDDFTLNVQDGANYTRIGSTITPTLDFTGDLTVPVTVFDGVLTSPVYNLTVTVQVDGDGDGVADSTDNCIAVANADQTNTDGDAEGDACDLDDDNDGVADTVDAFPLDATETVDTDSDSIGNNADTDDDGDGVADTADAFPLDASESLDTDGDGTGNNSDIDDDNDGIPDDVETAAGLNPLDAADAALDLDGDGISNLDEYTAGSDMTVPDQASTLTAPVLLSPTDHAVDIDPANASFRWQPASGSDGEVISYQLFLCDNADFSGCDTPFQVSAITPASLLAGLSGGSLILLGLMGLQGRRRQLPWVVGAVVLALSLVSCSSGSNGNNTTTPAANTEISHTITDLTGGAPYYWKVQATGSVSGSIESQVWQFTTR